MMLAVSSVHFSYVVCYELPVPRTSLLSDFHSSCLPSPLQTVGLIVYAQIVVVKVVIYPWMGFNLHAILFTCCTVLSFISHTRAQFTDPGAVPLYFLPPELPIANPVFDPEDPPPVSLKICKVCLTLKPKTAYHCSSCGRCIVRKDHHCPWVNNCVGVHNQKYFLLFLFYTALSCIYTGTLLVMRFLACSGNPRSCQLSSLDSALCIIAFVEALVFGLFVIIMMFDQLSAVLGEDEDAQAHYEEEMEKYNAAMRRGVADYMPMPSPPPPKTAYQALKEVFGGPISLSWLIPFTTPVGLQKVFDTDLHNCKAQADRNLEIIVSHLRKTMLKQRAYETARDREVREQQATCVNEEDHEHTDEDDASNVVQRRGGKDDGSGAIDGAKKDV